MNWSDLLVLGIIVVFAFIGMSNGFIFSIFRLASFFIAAIVSVKFYPVLANFLVKTSLFTKIKGSIYTNLLLQQQAQTPQVDAQVKQAAADTVVNSLHLPGFLKQFVVSHIPDPSKMLDLSQIMDKVSFELAKVVIDIMSLVLMYIIIRVGLVFLRFLLQGVAKLPLFKQMDKLGGFAFGAVEGLLTIYIIFAVAMLFNTAPSFKGFFDAVDNSLAAKFFFQHNFIIDWMFPKV